MRTLDCPTYRIEDSQKELSEIFNLQSSIQDVLACASASWIACMHFTASMSFFGQKPEYSRGVTIYIYKCMHTHTHPTLKIHIFRRLVAREP